MTSSSFLRLADGGDVRFDFEPSIAGGPSSLAYQQTSGDGHVGPLVTLVDDRMGVDTSLQLDVFNAAALTGGGFVVAYEERVTEVSIGVPPFELLSVVAHRGHGEPDALIRMVVGRDIAPGTTISTPGVFGLSGDTFGLVFERRDSGVVSEHLELPRTTTSFADTEPFDLTLPAVPNFVSTANGDLTLGFADGSRVLAGGDVAGALTGGPGNDTLVAGAGGDLMRGGDGGDLLQGGAHADDLNGNAGNDTLQGDAGRDLLRGGQGNDVILGGAGDDWLSGDRGADTLTGGAGADTFHSFAGAGLDVITDFRAAEGDRIQLDPGSAFTASQSGADVVIHVIGLADGEADIVLRNVQLNALPPGYIFIG